jgi:hypothetical protein
MDSPERTGVHTKPLRPTQNEVKVYDPSTVRVGRHGKKPPNRPVHAHRVEPSSLNRDLAGARTWVLHCSCTAITAAQTCWPIESTLHFIHSLFRRSATTSSVETCFRKRICTRATWPSEPFTMTCAEAPPPCCRNYQISACPLSHWSHVECVQDIYGVCSGTRLRTFPNLATGISIHCHRPTAEISLNTCILISPARPEGEPGSRKAAHKDGPDRSQEERAPHLLMAGGEPIFSTSSALTQWASRAFMASIQPSCLHRALPVVNFRTRLPERAQACSSISRKQHTLRV